MRVRDHLLRANDSPSYFAAKKFTLELEEFAKKQGYNTKGIKVRKKDQIVKGGYGKADAQVIWEDGPEDWALSLTYNVIDSVYYEANDGVTVSFYDLDTR